MRDYKDRRVTPPSGLPHLPGAPHIHINRPLELTESSKYLKIKIKTRTFLLTNENLVLQAMQFFIKSSDTQALVTKHAVCVLPHATARTRLPSISTSQGSGLKKQVFLNALELKQQL